MDFSLVQFFFWFYGIVMRSYIQRLFVFIIIIAFHWRVRCIFVVPCGRLVKMISSLSYSATALSMEIIVIFHPSLSYTVWRITLLVYEFLSTSLVGHLKAFLIFITKLITFEPFYLVSFSLIDYLLSLDSLNKYLEGICQAFIIKENQFLQTEKLVHKLHGES